jgi:hypothetical protein
MNAGRWWFDADAAGSTARHAATRWTTVDRMHSILTVGAIRRYDEVLRCVTEHLIVDVSVCGLVNRRTPLS